MGETYGEGKDQMEANAAVEEGRRVLSVEMRALAALRDALGEEFSEIAAAVASCEGKVVTTGMGKPGHIARKIAATLSSLGTPSFFLHPAEAMHGDLGMVDGRDLVLAISYSGESDEIVGMLPGVRAAGARLAAVTGNPGSSLARAADVVQVLPPMEEACHMGLAPTSSTTAALAYGDALAVAAARMRGFSEEDFGMRHPAGSLGKRLVLSVDEIMASGPDLPAVPEGATLADGVGEMAAKGEGAVCVVDGGGLLAGIVTDGDLRRLIKARADVYSVAMGDVMTRRPKTVGKGALAYDALRRIRGCDVSCLPVVDGNALVGLVTWRQIVGAGIVL